MLDSSPSYSYTLWYFHVRKLAQLDSCGLYWSDKYRKSAISYQNYISPRIWKVFIKKVYSQSVWIKCKAVSREAEARQHVRANDPAETPHPSTSKGTMNKTILYVLLYAVDFETASFQQLRISKGKLLSGKSSLLCRPAGNAATTCRGPGWTQHPLRGTLLPKAVGDSFDVQERGSFQHQGAFLYANLRCFPLEERTVEMITCRWLWALSPMTALLVHSGQQFQKALWRAETSGFNLLCCGNLKRWEDHKDHF